MKSALFEVDPQNYRKVAIVGDIHGDYRTLVGLLKLVDFGVDLLVFLGDYADRGAFGVETIRAIAGLQKKFSSHVVALMGNHEDYATSGEPAFQPSTLVSEAEKKTGSWENFFRQEFKPFIGSLYLTALIPGNALLVHGGVSTKLSKTDDLKYPHKKLRMDLLWSDPFDGLGERPNNRGAGVEFGADVSASVCEALCIGRIIRSHQPSLAKSGPALTHNNRVVTVQASRVYGEKPFVYFIDPKSTLKDSYCWL